MKESTELNPCPFFGGSEKIEEQLAEFRKPWPPKELEEMPEHDKLILYLCYRAIYLDYMERQQKLKEDGDTKHGDTIPDSSILESYTKRMEASVDNDNKKEIEMARYIDADELYKKIFPMDVVDKRQYSINAKVVAEAIDKTPTANVAPKADVDRLRFNLKAVLDERAVDKAEVAIEIFEEISRHLCYLSDDDIDAIRKRIGIQEKRYTEENK